jgi:hypothetical protein
MDFSTTPLDPEPVSEGRPEHGYVAPAIHSLGTLQGVTGSYITPGGGGGSGPGNELGPNVHSIL